MAKTISMTDDEILDLVQPDIDRARAHQTELSSEREESYNLYRFQPLGNERTGFSQVVDSIAWNSVEALKPNLHAIFTGDFFSLTSDNEDRAMKFKKYLRYILFRKQNGKRILKDWIHDSLLNHFGILKCSYREDYDLESKTFPMLTAEQFDAMSQDPNIKISKYTEVMVPAPMQPQPYMDPATGQMVQPDMATEVKAYEEVKAVRKVVKFAGPSVEVVPAWEFYYVPGYPDISACPFVAHKVRKTLDQIRKGERAGIYRKGVYDKVKDKVANRVSNPDTLGEIQAMFDVDGLTSPENALPSKNYDDNSIRHGSNEVDVWECYFMADIDKDGLLEPTIVSICEEVVIQDPVENPYGGPPFILGYCNREPHKIEGFPLPLQLRHEQLEQTNLRRLIVDSAAESTYRTVITQDRNMARQWSARVMGDAIIGNPDSIRESAVNPPNQFVLRAKELGDTSIEKKTGITSYNQGLDANSLNKTATGISMIMTASQMRQKFTAVGFADSLEELIRQMIAITQMYPPADAVRLLGTPIEVTADDLQGKFDIEIDVGTGPQEKQATAQQLDLHIKFLTQVGIPMGIATPVHLAETVYKKYGILDLNAKNIIMPIEEIQQKFANQPSPTQTQQMQQQMQQMDGAIKQSQQQIQQLQAELKRAQDQAQQLTQQNSDLKRNAQLDTAEFQLKAQMSQDEMALKRQELEANIALLERKLEAEIQIKAATEQAKIQIQAAKAQADVITKAQAATPQAEEEMIVG
jgi:hypothetical protein